MSYAHGLSAKKVSFFKDTLLENSKSSFLKKYKIFEMLFNGIDYVSMSNIVGLAYKSVIYFTVRLQEKAKSLYLNNIDKIGGEGIIIEVDESKFGKRKYNRGRRVEGVWVFGLVERTPERKVIYMPVEKRDRETLSGLVKAYCRPGIIIYSDCWRGYVDIQEDFQHLTVNHSKGFINKENGVHTNTIEGNWSNLKRKVPIRLRTKKKNYLPLLIAMERRNGSLKTFIEKLLK